VTLAKERAVNLQEGLAVGAHQLGQRARGGRLADTGGAEEEQGGARATRITGRETETGPV